MSPVLHLLCAPFPSPQGTQGAVAAMVHAARSEGRDHRLLVYAEGYGEPVLTDVRRLPRLPFVVGARSGPSLARGLHDLAATAVIRAHAEGARVLAHNVEAAWVCALARVPYVYVAHTCMREELPLYAERGASALRALGSLLDALAVRGATRTLAIAPPLARALATRHARPVSYVPLPWSIPAPSDPEERRRARRELGLPDDALVLLHAGNLDRYQGLDRILATLDRLGERARLLVATESDPRALRGRRAIAIAPLRSEPDRRRAHAAADVALLARTLPYGLPVKMLDALARGLPVVATRSAASGLALDEIAIVVDRDDPATLAEAVLRAHSTRDRRGPDYVAAQHGAASHVRALERAIAGSGADRAARP